MTATTHADHSRRILKVLLHIQRNLDEELSLEPLAEVACFSPYHFHRVFLALVGESVMAHIRRLRLERAALRLVQSDTPVVEMALDAGYETHESFTRAFKTAFGQSPSSFRKTRRIATVPSPTNVHYHDGADTLSFEPLTYGGEHMEVTIETWTERRVAFVRHIGPYADCGKAWASLCAWAGPRGLLARKPWFAGISYDDPSITPPEKLRYDACLAVDRALEPEGRVGMQTISDGLYAVALHEGPYENFHKTYSYLYGQWMPHSGYTPTDSPCVEIYLNDPGSTDPKDLLTRVCIPVKKA